MRRFNLVVYAIILLIIHCELISTHKLLDRHFNGHEDYPDEPMSGQSRSLLDEKNDMTCKKVFVFGKGDKQITVDLNGAKVNKKTGAFSLQTCVEKITLPKGYRLYIQSLGGKGKPRIRIEPKIDLTTTPRMI